MTIRKGDFVFTPHAREEMERRALHEAVVCGVVMAPEQRYEVRPGREVFQARVSFPDGTYLVRVFVDTVRRPAEIVTAYRTSKIMKYWRAGS